MEEEPTLFDISYDSLMKDPKRSHGIMMVDRGDEWYKDMKYEILETGGFLRLYTLRGRVYWLAQNMNSHETADWKIHFSIDLDYLPQAWDIISRIFVESRCEVGMKVTTSSKVAFTQNGGPQRGREITVYIYLYDESYGFGPMWQLNERGSPIFIGNEGDEQSKYYLGREFEAPYSPQFWFNFIKKVEKELMKAGIPNNGGVADGDFELPGCHYASLRNEAFVKVGNNPLPEYPPNFCGWNAAGHPNPLEDTIQALIDTL
eukprot:TRINITY_DN4652_c0_g2_i2.p1 TRINITY_DN4652_c0_g2~~TRINITY_DN4652_c0_g2_i2.p1  ORF type:complete len:260 (-),score=69.10 TRINITY_DN4652_c0_g2_i2:27-806(-)